MAFWCIFFICFLMLDFGMFSLVRFSMECLCMAPITFAMMVMRGLVFQPLLWMVLFSGSYLACLCVMAYFGNLSWQYVNSMNWIVCLGEGDIGGCVCFGAPITHRMSGIRLAWIWVASALE
jgi:hypothetical protein